MSAPPSSSSSSQIPSSESSSSSSSSKQMPQVTPSNQLSTPAMMSREKKRKSCHIEAEDENIFLDKLRNLQKKMGANLFQKAVKRVEMAQNSPRFPDGIVVTNIPRDEETEIIQQAQHPMIDIAAVTSQSNIIRDDSDMDIYSSTQFHRAKNSIPHERIGVQQLRDLQYHRWDWCCQNMDIYVNLLRKFGHSDESISRMVKDGQPLCMADEDIFQEFKRSVRRLESRLAEDTGWTNVSFVLTGSSVCGFSQNFLPPSQDMYGKYPSSCGNHLASRRDADDVLTICILANGVKLFMDELMTCDDSRLIKSYPATCTQTMGGLRYRFLQDDGYSLISSHLSAWYDEWTQKLNTIDLDISFGEDSLLIPPWEARLNLQDVTEQVNKGRNRALVSPPSSPKSPILSSSPKRARKSISL